MAGTTASQDSFPGGLEQQQGRDLCPLNVFQKWWEWDCSASWGENFYFNWAFYDCFIILADDDKKSLLFLLGSFHLVYCKRQKLILIFLVKEYGSVLLCRAKLTRLFGQFWNRYKVAPLSLFSWVSSVPCFKGHL